MALNENVNYLDNNVDISVEEENIIEAILFMMGESVTLDTLATALDKSKDIARAAADRLHEKYQHEYSNRGMKVIKLGDKYQMVSNNKYFKNLVNVASHPQKPVITEAILETLSIIAYKQPISKPEIENIRGVKSDYAVSRLMEYGLIEEKGRLETAGRPIIYGTTDEFMLRFGIESLDELPILDPTKFAEIEQEVEKELSDRLGEPVIIDKNKYNKVENNQNNVQTEKDNETTDDILEQYISQEPDEQIITDSISEKVESEILEKDKIVEITKDNAKDKNDDIKNETQDKSIIEADTISYETESYDIDEFEGEQ